MPRTYTDESGRVITQDHQPMYTVGSYVKYKSGATIINGNHKNSHKHGLVVGIRSHSAKVGSKWMQRTLAQILWENGTITEHSAGLFDEVGVA